MKTLCQHLEATQEQLQNIDFQERQDDPENKHSHQHKSAAVEDNALVAGELVERLSQGVPLSVCLLLPCHSLVHTNATKELIHLQMVCDKLKAASLKLNPGTCRVFHKGQFIVHL